MSVSAANPAGSPHGSMAERANQSLPTRNDGGGSCLINGGRACSNLAAVAATFRSQWADDNCALELSAVMYLVFCSVTASEPFGRPAVVGLLLRILRPSGISVPPETSLRTTAKNASQTSFGPLSESRPSALGSRAHSLRSAQYDPSNNGRIQQAETLSCTRTK
jgi:hypothetical protein